MATVVFSLLQRIPATIAGLIRLVACADDEVVGPIVGSSDTDTAAVGRGHPRVHSTTQWTPTDSSQAKLNYHHSHGRRLHRTHAPIADCHIASQIMYKCNFNYPKIDLIAQAQGPNVLPNVPAFPMAITSPEMIGFECCKVLRTAEGL